MDLLRSNNLDIDSNLSLRDSLAADIFESLLGAIFLDSSYSQCETVIINVFDDYLENIKTIGEISGPAHDPEFKITCTIKIYKSSEYVISKTVQAGQQAVSKIFLNKINNE